MSNIINIDINTKNNKGETALMLAAERGEYELVRWLLSNGSQIHLIDRQGGTAFTYALKNIMLPNSKFKFALLDERIRLQQSYFQIAGYLLFLSALQ